MLVELSIKIKLDSFAARDKSSLNSIFDKPTLSIFLKIVLAQMSIVSPRGILEKSQSTSRLTIGNSESSSTISSEKPNESFTFAEKTVEQDFEFFMGSLDDDSVFTNLASALIQFLKIQKG